MVRNALRALRAEPRPARASVRVWRDWALVAVLASASALELVLASDKMARRLGEIIPGFDVPESLLGELARGADVGVQFAVEQVPRLRDRAR